jgi:uncharacterized protein
MPNRTLDPTRLGTVEDVTGPRVSVKLADETAHGLLFVNGEGYRVGQVGSFVRIPAGYVDLFGIVAQVGAGAAPGPPDAAAQLGSRWLRVELVGEGRRGEKFERGISQYPSIGDSVHVVTESDLRDAYARGDAESHVAIGRVASAEGIPAYIDLNRLVSRHSAVVGSTGAGKSTAVSSLLAVVSDKARFPGARVVLLDLHGEYAKAFGDRARVFRIGADTSQGERELHIPFWALSAEELLSVSLGAMSGTVLSTVLDRICALKREAKPAGVAHGIPAADVTADTPLPFCIHLLWHELYCLHNATHNVSAAQNQSDATRTWLKDPTTGLDQVGDALSVRRPAFRPQKNVEKDSDKVFKSTHADQPKTHIETLEVRLRDPRLKFLFSPGDWKVATDATTVADLDTLLDAWIGADAPISVFDLSGIPKSVLDDLVGAMLRILYDAAFWGRMGRMGGRKRPLLVVLEEAHSYLGAQAKSRAASAARQVAKEGRKYGVGLMLVSQRPSEIDSTILAQCGTIVALRLTNEADRAQVRSCASDNLEGLFAMLPILRTGEALVVGEAVSMPVRALIALPPEGRRPDSEDPRVVVPIGKDGKRIRTGGWTEPLGKENHKAVVNAWRQQDPDLAAPPPQVPATAPAARKKEKN